MMNRDTLLAAAVVATALLTPLSTSAATVGGLTYGSAIDANNNLIITGAIGDPYYLGLGYAAPLSHYQTFLATEPGGIYQDYHIASQTEAFYFFNLASGANVQDLPGLQDFSVPLDYENGALGDNHDPYRDRAFFLSDEVGGGAGIMGFSSPFAFIEDRRGSLVDSDLNSQLFPENPQITWLLVSNQPFSPVPLPAAVWLFGSGLMGLVGLARRKKAA